MALIKAKGRQTTSVSRESEGADVYVKALRDGTLTMAGFFQALALEGRVYVVNGGGVAVTPIEFAGAYDADGADLVLDIPSGTAVMPISFEVVYQSLTDDTDIEVVLMASNMANTVTTATAVTPKNIRTNLGRGSNCTANVACAAANSTDVSGGSGAFCFARTRWEIGAAPAAAQSEEGQELRFRWSALDDGVAPVLVGASCIVAHVASTGGDGYLILTYAELPSSAII